MAYTGPYPFAVVNGGTGLTQAVAFSAYLNTTATNQTGDATFATVVFDTTLLNLGTGYSTSTGTFTAPVTGNYFFSTAVQLSNMDSNCTTGFVFYNATLNSVSYRWWCTAINPFALSIGGTAIKLVGCPVIIPMLINDAIHITCEVNNTTKKVGFTGATGSLTNIGTYFVGKLLL